MAIRGGIVRPYEGFARDVVRQERREWLHYGVRTHPVGIELGARRFVYSSDRIFNRNVVQNGIATHTWRGRDLTLDYNEGAYPRLELLGFAFGKQRTVPDSSWAIRVPYWALALAMLAPHGLVMARGLRKQRSINWRRGGRCAGCGYDLRSSEDRCPECGRNVASPAV
jgi:hypothetical protein